MLLNLVVYHLIVFINITLIGGVLPLIERKYLSLIQRRVGPKFVGYKGRLQFIADALKMFLKGVFIPAQVNQFWFLFWPSCFLSLCYLLLINVVWGCNIFYLELELNILFNSLISVILNGCILLTGFFSKNQYAAISAMRTFNLIFSGELLLGAFMLPLLLCTGSFSLGSFAELQEELPLVLLFTPILNIIVIIMLVEVSKAPFDLNEAETELITGYHTEYGAFFFALFYLGEYFHIFFTSLYLVVIFLGA